MPATLVAERSLRSAQLTSFPLIPRRAAYIGDDEPQHVQLRHCADNCHPRVAIDSLRVDPLRGHRSLIAGRVVKPSVQRLSGDECPCRVMVLSAVGASRRMMVSEAPAS